MDFNNEDQDQRPVTDTTTEPEAHAEATPAQEAQEAPVENTPTAEAPSGSYRGAGAGQKESPYANSPYYSSYQASQQNTGYIPGSQYQPPRQEPRYDQPTQEKPAKSPKTRKPMGKGAKRTIAAALAVVLVGGSCGATAWAVNNHWEKETAEMESSFNSQLKDLQKQVNSMSSISSGVSVSGTAVSAEGGLTPSQVYAMNVNSVVAVSNYATVTSSGWGNTVTGEQLAGTGSGFIISEDGYVMTNYHVIEDATRVTISTYMGDEYEATVVGYDELNDVALLKVDATGLQAVTIGSSDDLLVGDMVVAIGNPLGDELSSTQTVGYISGKDRSVSTDGTIINMLQTDAAINAGNSGGPLFNMKGEVVGITSAKYSGSASSGASIEGIGFAIPIDDVIGMIDDFKEYGYLRNQAYLGVTVMDMDSSTAQMYSLPTGSYVNSVVEGGSADRAGVQEKDIIIAIGDYDVDGNSTLTSVLRRFSAGDTTTITVFRAGKELKLPITFDEKPQNLTTDPSTESSGPSEEMPDTGDYDEWYDYFYRFFGGNGGGRP